MKKISTITLALIFTIPSFAQCTEELAAKIPLSCVQTNSYKYIGTNGKENKANTEVMYNKMVKIHKLFDSVFKNTTGMVGKWRAQVENKNNEGFVKGVIEISMQPITCKDNGEFVKSTGNPTVNIYVYINGFVPNLIKDKKKQPNFILDKDKADSLDGQAVYYINKAQEEEKFSGFPLYFYNWDNYKDASVIITKPSVSLFKPISIGNFLGLFKKWTTAYNAVWKGNPRYIATPEDIDKFTGTCTKEFLNKPMIYVWDGAEQLVYLRKTSYANDVTLGKQWVTINPDYLSKSGSETSIQFISLQFAGNTNGADKLTAKMLTDFKKNFDFKKLQAMLDK